VVDLEVRHSQPGVLVNDTYRMHLLDIEFEVDGARAGGRHAKLQ